MRIYVYTAQRFLIIIFAPFCCCSLLVADEEQQYDVEVGGRGGFHSKPRINLTLTFPAPVFALWFDHQCNSPPPPRHQVARVAKTHLLTWKLTGTPSQMCSPSFHVLQMAFVLLLPATAADEAGYNSLAPAPVLPNPEEWCATYLLANSKPICTTSYTLSCVLMPTPIARLCARWNNKSNGAAAEAMVNIASASHAASGNMNSDGFSANVIGSANIAANLRTGTGSSKDGVSRFIVFKVARTGSNWLTGLLRKAIAVARGVYSAAALKDSPSSLYFETLCKPRCYHKAPARAEAELLSALLSTLGCTPTRGQCVPKSWALTGNFDEVCDPNITMATARTNQREFPIGLAVNPRFMDRVEWGHAPYLSADTRIINLRRQV